MTIYLLEKSNPITRSTYNFREHPGNTEIFGWPVCLSLMVIFIGSLSTTNLKLSFCRAAVKRIHLLSLVLGVFELDGAHIIQSTAITTGDRHSFTLFSGHVSSHLFSRGAFCLKPITHSVTHPCLLSWRQGCLSFQDNKTFTSLIAGGLLDITVYSYAKGCLLPSIKTSGNGCFQNSHVILLKKKIFYW